MHIKSKSAKSSRTEGVRSLIRAKVFVKPSQGIAGIRHKGRPSWSAEAEQLLNTFRTDFSARGIANFCVGKKGRQFYSCLRQEAQKLEYAGKDGFWWSADILISKGKEQVVRDWAIKRFGTAPYPDSGVQNGHRIARYMALSGKDLETAVKEALYVNSSLHPDSVPKNSTNYDKLEDIRKEALKTFIDKAAENTIVFADTMASNVLIPPEIATKFEAVAKHTSEEVKDAIVKVLTEKGYTI